MNFWKICNSELNLRICQIHCLKNFLDWFENALKSGGIGKKKGEKGRKRILGRF